MPPAPPPARALVCGRCRAAVTRAVARPGPGRRCAPADTPTAPRRRRPAVSRRCETGRPMLTRATSPRWRSSSRPSIAERSHGETRPTRTNQLLFWPCTNIGSTGAAACAASRAAPSRHGASTISAVGGAHVRDLAGREHHQHVAAPQPLECCADAAGVVFAAWPEAVDRHHVLAHLEDAVQQPVAEQLHIGTYPAQHGWPGRGHRGRRAGGSPRRAAVRRRARIEIGIRSGVHCHVECTQGLFGERQPRTRPAGVVEPLQRLEAGDGVNCADDGARDTRRKEIRMKKERAARCH